MKLKFSQHIFEKYSSIKFHSDPWGPEFFQADGRGDGRKDWHEANVRFFAILQTRTGNQCIVRKEGGLF